MLGGTKLLIGDTHFVEPELDGVKENFSKVDLVICLGDLIDAYSDKYIKKYMPELLGIRSDKSTVDYLKELSKLFKKLGKKTIVVEGNHAQDCFETDNAARKMLSTVGLLSDYVCITDRGNMFEGTVEDVPKVKENFEVYVTEPDCVPVSVFQDKNAREFHLISHKQNTTRFTEQYRDYFHGHYHRLWKDGKGISSTIFEKTKYRAWHAKKHFRYKLKTRDIDRQSRHTPCISFFLDKGVARLEIIPGIFGDWMVLDPGSRRVVYRSQKAKEVFDIDLEDFFLAICDKGGYKGYNLLI